MLNIRHGNKKYFSIFALGLGLSLPGLAQADNAPTATTATTTTTVVTPAPAATPPASPYKFTGYIDGSYNYLVRADHFISGVNDRVFDLNPNGVTLQQASVTLGYQPTSGFGFLVNPIIGRDPATFASYGINPNLIDSTWLEFDVPQAFFQLAAGPVTVLVGRFVTIAGVEVIDPTQDTNFSRSILFGYAIPFTVTGARATYVVNDKLTLNLGVDDGWDNIRDWSRGQTIEYGISTTINPMFSFSVQGYTGEERATPFTSTGPKGRRTLVDAIGTMNATANLTFILNYDYAVQKEASLPDGTIAEAVWTGAAGYINYKFDDKWRMSFRGEVFDDRNGFRTGVVQAWKELTLTIAFDPITNCEIRAETRYDFSNVESFVDKGPGVSKNQQSFAVEAYYKF